MVKADKTRAAEDREGVAGSEAGEQQRLARVECDRNSNPEQEQKLTKSTSLHAVIHEHLPWFGIWLEEK